MEKKEKKRWIIIGGVGLLVVILIAWAMMPTPVLVQMAEAKRGQIHAYVEERAQTSLPQTYRMTMPQDGRILPITLEPGTAVKQGDVVAQMDVADLVTQMKEVQDLVQAMDRAVKASAEKVSASRAQEDYAGFVWNAQQDLYNKKQISKNAMKESERDFLQSKVGNRSDAFTLQAMTALDSLVRLAPTYFDRRLKRSVLTSPIDGHVLERHVSNELVLQAGSPLLDIGDLSRLEVTSDILSDEAVDIRPGNPVEIYGPSIGQIPIHGMVKRVDPQGFIKISSLGVEQLRVHVKISVNPDEWSKLQAQGKSLGVDYRVLVRVFTAVKDNVVKVPRTALFRGSGGEWEVFVVKRRKARLVKVKVGLTNDQEAEVIEGVAQDQTVIVAPPSSLTSGTSVKKG